MSESEYDSADSPVAGEGAGTGEVDREGSQPAPVEDVSAGESASDAESEEEEEGEEQSMGAGRDDSLTGEAARGSGEEAEGGEGAGERMALESSDEEIERPAQVEESESRTRTKGVKTTAFLDSDDSEGEGGEGGKDGGGLRGDVESKEEAGEVAAVSAGGRKFLEDSDDEAEEAASAGDQSRETGDPHSRNDSLSQEDVFGDESDAEAEETGKKRRRRSSLGSDAEEEGEGESGVKRLREASGSGDEQEGKGREEGEEEEEGGGSGELDELREEVVELGEEGEGEGVPEVGGERVVGEEEEEPPSDDEAGPSTAGMSDWEIMIMRRKEAMAKARKRRKRDIDITAVDDHIMAMIRQMRQAAEEDRQLNLARQPALKKLKMLPTVIIQLKKADLQTSFIECGILTILAEWLGPLPDHSLPHLKIRESILDILKSYPILESHILKSSRVGKAVMLLYRHPKETRKNKEKAGKLINEWARPIFGLDSDFKSLGRDEREERDYANLSQAAKRRLSSSSDPKKASQDEDFGPQKPGDKGWVGRARVPMPSTRDYVVRPKWKVDQEFKKGSGKKVMNRYEKQIQKEKQRKMQGKSSHAISISVEGRKMPL